MERVSLITGKMPIVFLCPHGADNPALAKLAEEAAFFSEGNAIINRGFKRGPQVNYAQEIADLSRLDHCLQENVIFEEFLRPIVRIKNHLKKKHKRIFVYVLSYLPNAPADIDLVIGYGNGENYTVTCPIWAMEVYVATLRYLNLGPYKANDLGPLTGSEPISINQVFRVYDYEKNIFSLSLWLNEHLLGYTTRAASALGDAAVELTKHKSNASKPIKVPVY